MIQIQKILVPTDFSQFSSCALKYGCEFARKFSAELHIVNVVEDLYPLVPEPGMLIPDIGDQMKALQEVAEKTLQNLPPGDWGREISVVRAVLMGTAFLEIVRYARENEIDLLVIGTHGRSGLMQALLGSVTEKVVRKSPCPVLTVRPEGHSFVMP